MKKGWEYKTIKEIGTVIGGTTPSTNNKEYWDGEHCWISPAELDGSHYLYDSVRKVTDKAVKDKNLKLLPIGTVILSSRAPIGKVTINKIPTYCNQGFKCVICGNRVYNEFLYWWFWGKTEYLNSIGTGATFKEISKKVVENIIIPVPPLSKQKEIVEYLDSSFAKIDKLKENAAKNLEEAKALFQSALKDALEQKKGWEEKTINDVVLFRNGIAHEKDIDKGGNYIVINSKFVATEGTIRKYTNEQLSPLYTNEIVMVMSDVPKGKTLAKCYIIDCDNKYSLNQRICAFKSKGLDVKFLYYLLNRNPHLLKYDNGENQTNLRKKQILECPLTFPSQKNEQQRIVICLDSLKSKVDRLQENYDKISQECDALKQAILRQVFE